MKSVIFKDKRAIPHLLWRSLRWHINYFLSNNPSPLACGFYITNKCNFKCNFCNIWRKPTIVTAPLSKARNIVDDLSSLGCFYFSITGGEPLVVDYLFDLLLYARKTSIKYIHMVTNGYMLDIDKAKKLSATGINEISISIDGDKEMHDKRRGMPGAYERALKAIEHLKKHAPEVKIVLNTIFFPEEPSGCLHVVELAKRLNVYIKVQPLNRHPIFKEDNHGTVSYRNISPAYIQEAITRLRKEDRVVNSDAFLDNIYNFFCQKENLIFRNSSCLFGYHHIEILEDGSVFPCLEGLHWKNGMNVHGSLKDLIRSTQYKYILERLKKCRGCQHNYYICYYEPRILFPINNFLMTALRR